jgi:RES domain-containing protein
VAVALWRIARRPYALDRTGLGARDHGGRWNRAGTAVIYAGSTIAIAALERFVHLAGVVPSDLVLVRVDLPNGSSEETPELSDFPKDWALLPPSPASMNYGTRWARDQRSLVLYVPSVLVREERNVVINPVHSEFAAVTMTIERPFRYDARMFRGAPR